MENQLKSVSVSKEREKGIQSSMLGLGHNPTKPSTRSVHISWVLGVAKVPLGTPGPVEQYECTFGAEAS